MSLTLLTLTNFSGNGYQAGIGQGWRLIWQCAHQHQIEADALRCASEEAHRRGYTREAARAESLAERRSL